MALLLLGILTVLSFVLRIWLVLLPVVPGLFAAGLRLLYLSFQKEELPETQPAPQKAEPDPDQLAYAAILKQVTKLVTADYPQARWIWEAPNARKLVLEGRDMGILLNRAGGYRRATVFLKGMQVTELQYDPQPLKPEAPEEEANYELLAFEWVDAHIQELDAKRREAAAQKLSELVLPEEELPIRESWPDICRELAGIGLEKARCATEGIKISLI